MVGERGERHDAAPQLEGVAEAGLHFELLVDSVVEHGRERGLERDAVTRNDRDEVLVE